MDREDVFDGDLSGAAQPVDGPAHRLDVVEDFHCRDIGSVIAHRLRRLRLEEAATANLKALDTRGCDGLCTEQQPSYGFGVNETACFNVEPRDGTLGFRHVGGSVPVEPDAPAN